MGTRNLHAVLSECQYCDIDWLVEELLNQMVRSVQVIVVFAGLLLRALGESRHL